MIHRSLLAFLVALLFCPLLWAQGTPCGTVTIQGPDSLNVCQGDIVPLLVVTTLIGPTLTATPAADLVGQAGLELRIRPSGSGYYKVMATAGSCAATDSIYIDVDRLVVPQLINDSTVCQGYPINLLANPVTDPGNTSYTLRGGDEVIAVSRDPNFTVRLTKDTVFTLISRSDNGSCEDRQTVNLSVIPGFFDIPQDTIFACQSRDTITLSVATSPPGSTITWSPERFNLSPATGNSFKVVATADITYFARTVINGCQRIDSVAVRLDSLPGDLSMMLDPEKDPYCQGDTFYVRSPVYDAGDFPLITHNWITSPGIQSPNVLYNGVFIGRDTAILQRETTNGACRDTNEILVNVVEPPVITFAPSDPVCPGESVQITATFESGDGTLTWTDPAGTLSCTDCLNPTAIVSADTEYSIEVESEGSQCTSTLTYTLRVNQAVQPTLTAETLICPGDARPLLVGNIDPNYTYRITGGGLDSADPNVLVSPTETTTYTIVTTSDTCGETLQTITLVVLGDYTVTASGPGTVCAGTALTLNATSPEGLQGTYTWSLPDGTTVSGQMLTVNTAQAGTYTVTFTDALGCSSATSSITVDVLGQSIAPVVTATLADGTTVTSGGTLFAGNDVILRVANLPEDLTFTYNWSGNYTPATGTGPELTVNVPRSTTGQVPPNLGYTVTLTSEQGGCVFTGTIFLTVEQSQVQAPDFFTPDNDGRNDRFRLFFNGQLSDYTMIVYDRWGQKVFTSIDPLEGWDGTKGGTPQNADVYLYLAKFRQDGVELQQEGQVSLIR